MLLVRAAVVVTVALLLVSSCIAADDDNMVVQLQQGLIKGVKVPLGDSRHFYSFKGIPYARPPVGDLRFRDPVAGEGWTGVMDSSTPPQCPQLTLESYFGNKSEVIGEEDCLYLNVYTPRPYSSDLPVMVFIHGGGYALGNADDFGGRPKLLLTRDIVLVSIQYRLGTLGFLSTEDAVLPGNLGLKDQTKALHWVHNNIKSMGGDPNRITIVGESAGASSVDQHILSPMSRGLFQRAIMQSGSALSSWSLRDDHRRIAGKIGQMFNCTGVSSETIKDSLELMSCLQALSTDDLVLANSKISEWYFFPYTMVPRVDGEFLTDHPASLLKRGEYNKVDIITGTNLHEGISSFLVFLQINQTNDLVEKFDKVGPLLLAMDLEESSEHLARRIFHKYLGSNLKMTRDNVAGFSQVYTDLLFVAPQDAVMQHHAKDDDRNIYMYQMEHHGQVSLVDFFSPNETTKWVSHADELLYLFNDVFGFPPLEHPEDLYFSDILLTLWTNFAATGRPTPDFSLGFRWHPISSSCLQYLRLSLVPTMQPDTRAQVRKFFEDLPTKQNKLFNPERFNMQDVHECLF